MSTQTYALDADLELDFSDDVSRTVVEGWHGATIECHRGGTSYGIVLDGEPTLNSDSGVFQLRAGMYFSSPGLTRLSGAGRVMVSTRLDYQGFFSVGGPVEQQGRLRYINGCTDSVLVAPIEQGDPCLNLLSIPPRVIQTRHTHPSIRVGLVVAGEGACHAETTHHLTPGQVFVIPAHSVHCFETYDHSMTIVAYHPDSDCGPTHDNHPMLNRTVMASSSVNLSDVHK